MRKTESRIPVNVSPDDLGQAMVAPDGRCALISYITSPLVSNRENGYVVLVTDAGLASAAQSFVWTFVENGGTPTTETTPHGEFFYRPQATGTLNIAVRILNAGNAEQATLELTQDVVPLNAELEDLITNAANEPGPGAGNPDVARELINDHNPYYQSVALKTPEAGDSFQRLVFSLVYDGALQHTPDERKDHLAQLAAALNSQTADFATLATQGAGVSGLRLALLAMTLGQLPWTELPEPTAPRAAADEQLCQQLAALPEATRIDLFNLVRFPKSNITQCAHVLEALRDRYFKNAKFDDVLTKLSGTMAHWIVRHYREGPLLKS